jgi:hypothetical protein
MLPPKEEAKKIIRLFQSCLETPLTRGLRYDEAILCALMSVELILDAVTPIADKKYEYYEKVKNEIHGLSY